MDWKEYELAVFDLIKSDYPDALVSHNVYLDGVLSRKRRQIDILIEEKRGENTLRTVIDTKFYSRKVDVKGVESFIGMLGDVQANKGILVSNLGFSDAAAKRAFYDHAIDIEVEIFNFNELHQFQAFAAIPHNGKFGVMISSPLGWVIDGARNPDTPATLYRRGFTLEEAKNKAEFMYVNFWDKTKDNESLRDLVKKQEANIINFYSKSQISYSNSITTNNIELLTRKVIISEILTEYTTFAAFKNFIFFFVLLTPIEMSKKNLRKLNNVVSTSIPINIKPYGKF